MDLTAAPALQLRDLRFAYRGRDVLRGVSVSLGYGEVVSLLGANGAGKSTLLRLALGLIGPSSGKVLLGGQPIERLARREVARRIAYVPQTHVPPFPFKVLDVVMLGRLAERGLFRPPGPADRAVAAECLERLGVAHLARRAYTEISGGERQLTLIARALAQGARILIMDEPATGLDFGHQIRLLKRLRDLAADNYGILMSTHHPDHAAAVSTHVILLKDGMVLSEGPPSLTITSDAIFRLYGVRANVAPNAIRDAMAAGFDDEAPLATPPAGLYADWGRVSRLAGSLGED